MALPASVGGALLPVGTGLERAIEELMNQICPVPEEIRRLVTTVNRIAAVLKDAEEKQISSCAVRLWLGEAKEVLLDAEDLIDELTTDAALQSMGAHGGKRVRTELRHRSCNIPTMTPAMEHQIRDVKDRADGLALQVSILGLQISTLEDSRFEWSRRRQTSSLLPDETSVIGRDREKEEIMRKLLPSTQAAEYSTNRGFSVLSIVGMGGVGKTALAQLVFNDQNVKEHFELRMWVCVSTDFDTIRLTKEIIEAVLNKPYQVCNWDTMQQKLRREVEGKAFLLVLDDVWETDQSKWEDLLKPLHFGKKGSKILVTARDRSFVDKIQGRVDPVPLGGLADADFWSLFKKYAFNGVTNANGTIFSEYSHLQAIGRQHIVPRLKGSPLAARTVGSLLNTELDAQHWRTVLESKLWMLEQGVQDILLALLLSYQFLSRELKQCFAYCSLFPKDYRFYEDMVAQFWEAQCFIRTDGHTGKEATTGNKYLDELLYRSFFEHAPSMYGQKLYVMHDLMHDVAEYISKGDCLRLEDQNSTEIPDTIRHISVSVIKLDRTNLDKFCRHVKLRSLFFLDNWMFDRLVTSAALDELFSKLKLLRVLGLHHCGIRELPDSVGDLKHLRYLDLSENGRLKNLPESLGDLYNLQVLKLINCFSLRALPARMSELINLRHLQAKRELISGIDGLGKLTGLQELTVGGSKVWELGGMSMLRRLTIWNLEEVGTKENAIQARLHSMERLQVLHLAWSGDGEPGNSDIEAEDEVLQLQAEDQEVLQALRPNDGIEEIHICCYEGVKTPDWMETPTWASFSSLTHLELECCPNWQVLPSSLSQLRHLESLIISDMYRWEEWRCPLLQDGDHHPNYTLQNPSSSASLFFPCLCELKIVGCPKLKELPLLPPTLRHLHLERVGLSCLPGFMWGCNRGGGGMETTTTTSSHSPSVSAALSSLHITGCDNLTSINRLLQHQLPNLEGIDIMDCEELVSLPERGLGHLVSLKKLCIVRCPKLTCPPLMQEEEEEDIPPQHLPCSLEELLLERCGDAMGGWWWAGLQCLTSLAQLSLREYPSAAESLLNSLGNHPHPHRAVTVRKLEIYKCGCDNQQGYITSTSSSLPPPPPTRPLNPPPPLVDDDDASAGVIRALTSLTDVTVDESPNVMRKLGGRGLPSSIERLTISGYDNLDDECLSTCLQDLTSLRSLSLKNLVNVRSLTNLSCLSSLERLDISDCPSMQSLLTMPTSLKELTFQNMDNLWSLPETLSCLSSLESLRMDDCPSIHSLPAMTPSLKELTLIRLENVQSIPDTLSCLSSLELLSKRGCPSIQSLPAMPASLKKLTFGNMDKLWSLPDALSCLSSLEHLEIRSCPIHSLPAMPPSLKELSLSNLENVQSIPDTLSCLSSLELLYIYGCPSIQSLPAMPASLKKLTFGNMDKLWSLPDALSCLSSLECLEISTCPIHSLPAMPPSLKKLTLSNLENVQSIPDTLSCLSSLESLSVHRCPIHSFPAMPPSLKYLFLDKLENLQSIPNALSCVSSLAHPVCYSDPPMQLFPSRGLAHSEGSD